MGGQNSKMFYRYFIGKAECRAAPPLQQRAAVKNISASTGELDIQSVGVMAVSKHETTSSNERM